MLVQYFIQNEKNKEPYAFNVNPSEQEITVGDIKANFPCPGNFYLRFKTVLQDQVPITAVWLDGLDDFAPVPTFKDQIIVKALAIPPFPSTFSHQPPHKLYKESKPLEIPTQRKHSDFLFTEENHMRSHSAAPNQKIETKSADFPKKVIDPTGGLNTQQLKERTEDRIKKQMVQKTEDVKKQWDDEANLLKEKQNADREYSEKLNNWETRNHQKNNISALLATMHTVLWPDSGWEPIGPGDVITPAQVKTMYFKSLNIIHPDKHQQDPPHIRYISERVFGAVNKAFKLFRSSA